MRSSHLIIPLLLTPLLSVYAEDPIPAPAEPAKPIEAPAKEIVEDFINFRNDDTLHGKFLGFTTSGKIIWNSKSAENNIAFTASEARKIIINKGLLVKPFSHNSHVTLTNLDTIPGEITAVSDKSVTLKTDYAGEVTIPRANVSKIDFLPLGDKIRYRGPYIADEWIVHPLNYSTSNSKPDPKQKDPWEFLSFSWQNKGTAGVLMSKLDLEDQGRITFNIASANTVMPSLILFADQKVPEVKNEDDKKPAVRVSSRTTSITKIAGSSLIFRLHNSGSSLAFYSFNEDGSPFTTNLTNMISSSHHSNNRIDNSYVDIRHDKENGLVLLYLNKRMVGKWDISDFTKKLVGKKMGFANLYTSNSNSYIVNDIVVSSWNGVTDPAASMEHSERDIVLLTNGTDRYSGDAIKIIENKLLLKGPYAELFIPTDQIQSLALLKKDQKELPARTEDDVTIRFHGSGRITGTLSKGPEGRIIVDTKALGKLTIDLSYVSSYEFEDMDYAFEIIK